MIRSEDLSEYSTQLSQFNEEYFRSFRTGLQIFLSKYRNGSSRY